MIQIKGLKKDSILLDGALWYSALQYAASILLVFLVLYYVLLAVKLAEERQILQQLNNAAATYNTAQARDFEKKAVGYQQQLDSFSKQMDSHVATSRAFDFLESSTLANVWFLTFTLNSAQHEIRLSGQASSAQALGGQVEEFEQNHAAVSNVQVSNLKTMPDGSISFDLILSLNPQVLQY